MKNYKLYTDGSYYDQEKIAGFGGYIVDEENNVIEKFSEVITSPELFQWHERLALKKGLELAIEKGIKNLTCYTDDSGLSKRASLSEDKLGKRASNKIILNDIVKLKESFDEIQIQWTPRKLNNIADKLSREALKKIKDFFPSTHIGISKKHKNFKEVSDKFTDFLFFDVSNDVNIFYATKNLENQRIETKLVTKLLGQGASLGSLVNCVTETLKEFINVPNLVFCTYKGNGQELSDVIKGKSPVFNAKKELKVLAEQLKNHDNIHYHMDHTVLDAIYKQHSYLNHPKTKEEIFNAIKELGDDNYVLGENLSIENHPEIKQSRKDNIAEIQKFYFSKFLSLGLRELPKEDKKIISKAEVIKNKIMELREEFKEKGIKLRM